MWLFCTVLKWIPFDPSFTQNWVPLFKILGPLSFLGKVHLVLIWTHFDLTVNDSWTIHEKFQPWTLLSHFDILFNHLWTVSYHFVTLLNHFGTAWAILGLYPIMSQPNYLEQTHFICYNTRIFLKIILIVVQHYFFSNLG